MDDRDEQTASLDNVMDLLATGEMSVRGLLPGSSNYTFLAELSNDRFKSLAIYKPRQGEAPLWDFPHGTLCNRELAAYLVSQGLGWTLVPPTVLRIGPYGRGAVQFFVDADFNQHYFTFQSEEELFPLFRRVTAFDLIINNADRKAGHILRDQHNRLWAIDHGVCFHPQPKLRTVVWEFAGMPLTDDVTDGLSSLRSQLDANCELHEQLNTLLSAAEMRALVRRTEHLLSSGSFPDPDPYRRSYPWPLV